MSTDRKKNIRDKQLLESLTEEQINGEMTEIKKALFHQIHRHGNKLASETDLDTSLSKLLLLRKLSDELNDLAEIVAASAVSRHVSLSNIGRAYGLDPANVKRKFKDLDAINAAKMKYYETKEPVPVTINGRTIMFDRTFISGEYKEKSLWPRE